MATIRRRRTDHPRQQELKIDFSVNPLAHSLYSWGKKCIVLQILFISEKTTKHMSVHRAEIWFEH